MAKEEKVEEKQEEEEQKEEEQKEEDKRVARARNMTSFTPLKTHLRTSTKRCQMASIATMKASSSTQPSPYIPLRDARTPHPFEFPPETSKYPP